MAELLVRVVDKTNPDDIYLDAQLTKRGDVIVVNPDGWRWSERERTNPAWRIIRVDMPLSEAKALLQPERPQDEQDTRETLQRRAFKLDVDSLSLSRAIAEQLADDKRAAAVIDLSVTVARAIKVTKPAIADPRLG